jgi:hypothetical protein
MPYREGSCETGTRSISISTSRTVQDEIQLPQVVLDCFSGEAIALLKRQGASGGRRPAAITFELTDRFSIRWLP